MRSRSRSRGCAPLSSLASHVVTRRFVDTMADDPDFDSFPLAAKGHAFEDFREGQNFEHHWGRTLTEADNALFTTLALRFTPLYFNAQYAARAAHAPRALRPALVLS